MKTKPDATQIAAEIAALKELQPKVRPTSMFGDDNRAAIGAQIEVLTERLSVNQVHDVYGEDAFEDEDEFDQHTFDCALEAHDWMSGEAAGEEKPSDGWNGLVP